MTNVRVACLNNNDRINPRKRTLPVYPPEALARRVQDVVIVEFTVEADGRVADARIVRSVPALDEAALAAVRRWEFTATDALGAAVRDTQTVAMDFALS
jgi:protein TonB